MLLAALAGCFALAIFSVFASDLSMLATAAVLLALGASGFAALWSIKPATVTLVSGRWTVDGEEAVLRDHAVLGPFVSLTFDRRTLLVTPDAADPNTLRRLRIHLRSVHRPEAAIR